MENITFDYIWDNIVMVTANEICRSIGKEEAEQTDFKLRNSSEEHNQVYKLYVEVKDRLKQFYHYGNNSMNRRIDIHKVAACFASVLMKYKLFTFNMNEYVTDAIFLSNANLAYSVSLGIIKMNLLFKYKDNESICNRIKTSDLFIPQTTEGHDSYHKGRIKTIALNDVFECDFDILTYSDMLYWIELFNIMILEGKAPDSYIAFNV